MVLVVLARSFAVVVVAAAVSAAAAAVVDVVVADNVGATAGVGDSPLCFSIKLVPNPGQDEDNHGTHSSSLLSFLTHSSHLFLAPLCVCVCVGDSGSHT